MTSPEIPRNPIEKLAEEFLERYRRGERPALTEYAQKNPELAAEIRELFPALVMMEEAGIDDAEPAGVDSVTADGTPLERVGDYRILREVGRGGMGVVYEAEHQVLGRHVALKVLPFQAAAEPMRLLRFRREARSAARLHHSNIVPVFDVGEYQGIHYYAMQLIHGQGLDDVLVELRRLRSPEPSVPNSSLGPGSQASAPDNRTARPSLTHDLAKGLASGQFPALDSDGEGQQGSVERPTPDGEVKESDKRPVTNDEMTERTASSLSFPQQSFAPRSELSSLSGSPYYRSVARLALQVAEALAYAHGQKVLHRDIKPANLLIDVQGTVWVSDFGLAKAEGDDLTRTGDVVGTMRYMAPERLNGVSDARSDVYSLGLTLYELLTLRTAFEESDRGQLIKQITDEEPTPPRKLDRSVPRDLETIVLKAIAKEPGRRYQTAEEMAEDLRRYLADRPILARRSRTWEQGWRWCRRNPAGAALIAAVTLLAVGSLVAAWRIGVEANRSHEAERDATERLLHASYVQAQASRSSARIGQRLESLKALQQAAEISRRLHSDSKTILELRNEAIACLALPDLVVEKEWEGNPPGTNGLAFDSHFERYARTYRNGPISVRRVADDQELLRLPGCSTEGLDHRIALRFSPDDRFLAAWYFYRLQNPKPLLVWDLGKSGTTPCLAVPDAATQCDFSPDGRWALLGLPDGTLRRYDLATGKQVQALTLGYAPEQVSYHADGHRVAVAVGCPQVPAGSYEFGRRQPGRTQILELASGQVVHTLLHGAAVTSLAWHPDGHTLATGCFDHHIYLWDMQTGQTRTVLAGHYWEIAGVAFNHAGDLLASASHDNAVRLWDPRTGQHLLTIPFARWIGFSRDDRLGPPMIEGTRIRLCRLVTGREYRLLARQPGYIWNVAFHPGGRLLAAGGDDAPQFWDVESSGGPLGRMPFLKDHAACVLFHPSGDSLISHSQGRLQRWPIRSMHTETAHRLRIGPPETLHVQPGSGASGYPIWRGDAAREIVVSLDDQRLSLLDVEPKAPAIRTLDVHGPDIACSPDGRWLAIGSSNGLITRVWDTWHNRVVREWTLANCYVAFSPDGEWLVTGTGRASPEGPEYCFWRVGTWEPGLRIPIDRTTASGFMAFSADGNLLALQPTMTDVMLLNPHTGAEIAILRARAPLLNIHMAFSPEGSVLAVGTGAGVVQVWDLRLIRERLAEMGLDWDLPPYPRSVEQAKSVPLTVELIPAEGRPREKTQP